MKYTPQYILPPTPYFDWLKRDRITHTPQWCSVDLRDGNQSLINPMTLEQKLAFFALLVELGFKQIEVGFPAASQTERDFLRRLIDDNLIPDDVTVQVLTQARDHIIAQTFEAIQGIKRVVVHVYNSTSIVQREQVFNKSKEEIIALAVNGAVRLNEHAALMPDTEFIFEYSPESFTGTEPEYALEICNAVLDVWQPSAARPAIINLPATVENAMPHVFGQQIAYMNHNLKYREHVILSLHPHNDRGTGVAAAEMGLLAGADRIEGTLFGNGERTGNVDIITLAMNLYTHGVDSGLNFSDMPRIVNFYESVTGFTVAERQPYAGELVFAAFSGSHQDAIAKGMAHHKDDEPWVVPYLPIDPRDVNREYDTAVIRINSQSGKGGVGYILERNYGYKLPPELRMDVGYLVKDLSDKHRREVSPQEINDAFADTYVNVTTPFELLDIAWDKSGDDTLAAVQLLVRGTEKTLNGRGNGSLDALRDALTCVSFTFADYFQHALEGDSTSRAAAYVKILADDNTPHWGVGVHHDITTASCLALISAVNQIAAE